MMRITAIFIFAVAFCARADTSFYVDAYWTGTASGAASQPWQNLNSPANAQWTIIRAALATGPVNVYFSALKTDGVSQEIWTNQYNEFRRNDGSNALYVLTFDGGSFYNTSEISPNWQPNPTDPRVGYTNHQVACLFGDSANNSPKAPSESSGWTRSSTYRKQSKCVFQFFEQTGYQTITSFQGDTNRWQWLYIHDVEHLGAGLTHLYTFPDPPTVVSNVNQQLMARDTNNFIGYCVIHNTHGESIYLGGANPDIPTNIQAQAGNQSYIMEVASNTLDGAGVNGAGGSGINTKNGIIGLWIHDNIVGPSVNQQWGIDISQSVDGSPCNELVERNIVFGTHGAPGSVANGIYAVADNFLSYNGIIIRNNLVYSNGNGVKLESAPGASLLSNIGALTNISVYNNTFAYNDGDAIICSGASCAGFTNNLCISNAVSNEFNAQVNLSALAGGGVLQSDYNAYLPTWGFIGEGAHSFAVPGSILFIDPIDGNFGLAASAPVIARGFTIPGLLVDLDQNTRTPPLDIGALAFESGSQPPPPPPPPPPAGNNGQLIPFFNR